MARRRASIDPPAIEARQFTRSDIEKGIIKLKRRIDEVDALDPRHVQFDDAKVKSVEANIGDTIREVFGDRSQEFCDHGHHKIRHGGNYFGNTRQEYQQKFAEGIPQTVAMINGLIARLEEKRADMELDPTHAIFSIAPLSSTRRVFVVHGHDEGAKDAVARFLAGLDLEPIILHEQPNQGRTVIEKFEGNAEVDFAVVLLTPDDVGHLADAPSEAKPRARQNVIFELGYFVGRLGRARVCALHKSGVEILSDYNGVIYVPIDDQGAWKLQLAKEIKAAGIDVDLNRAI